MSKLKNRFHRFKPSACLPLSGAYIIIIIVRYDFYHQTAHDEVCLNVKIVNLLLNILNIFLVLVFVSFELSVMIKKRVHYFSHIL